MHRGGGKFKRFSVGSCFTGHFHQGTFWSGISQGIEIGYKLRRRKLLNLTVSIFIVSIRH